MKVHAYLLCYNEELIIKNVLEYYSKFCSKIFVMDNMSTDKSVEIASSYSKVNIIPWSSDAGIDESLYVKMKSQTYKHYSRDGGCYTEEVADWVISCDMDEILYHPQIVDILSKYDDLGVTVPQITGFDVVGSNSISDNVPMIEQYQHAVRAKGFDKRIVFKPSFDISYHQGCHPRGSGFDHMKNTFGYKTSNKYPLSLLHYKHIGERLYSSAKKNLSRMSDNDCRLSGRGKESAVAKYYKNIVDRNIITTPLLESAKPIFKEGGLVDFDAFEPTTGENGIDNNLDINQKIISEIDIDLLRDLAIQIEKFNLDWAIVLMELAKKYRPDGNGIVNKLKSYYKRNEL